MSAEDRPLDNGHLGLGGAFYLHRFLYKTRKSQALHDNRAPGTTPEDEKRAQQRQQNALNAREAVYDIQKKMEAREKGKESRAWDVLKQRLATAKVEEALLSAKVYVNEEKFTILRPLGEGGYSSVYEVYSQEKKLYALKIVNLERQNENVKKDLISEIVFLERLKHCDLVVKAFDYELRETETEHKIFMLMEKGDKDLFQIFLDHKNSGTLSPAKLRSMFNVHINIRFYAPSCTL